MTCSSISYDDLERRARKLCCEAEIDPDFMAYEGQDDTGYAIRNPNWMLFVEQAEDELKIERAVGGAA